MTNITTRSAKGEREKEKRETQLKTALVQRGEKRTQKIHYV